ncbi:hypothetical protein [Arthrobacter sp. M4]|uniref:hypothetical protein n=1 Tax=Arthrobacter sp. M4 TaxID=218160 RepID=UPI001CDD6237|nr:hypothetical protein [Arthrobacter sp. M4]MCA4134032.1 hypothetical protein [Arthrobacter sp. M4]
MTSNRPIAEGAEKGRGRKRLILILGAGALVIGATTTAAAYTDFARLNLGTGAAGSGLGNPNRFDIAVKDSANALQDAETPADAVVLPLTSGAAFSESAPVQFDVTVANRTPGVTGDLAVTLYDPDAQTDDLFDTLRFSVYLDGAATPAIANASAQQVNQAGLKFADVAPGQEHSIRVTAILPAGSGAMAPGKATQLGVLTNGESK